MRMSDPPCKITESRGRAGLSQLEADWRGLYGAIERRNCFLSYEANAAYVDNLMALPDQLRCLRLSDGQRTRAICLLEPRWERRLGRPVRIWGLLHHHEHLIDVLCPDDEARRALVPALARHLRGAPEGRRLLALGPLPVDSSIWEGMCQLESGDACMDPAGIVRMLDSRRPFAEVLAGISGKSRYALKTARKRLQALPVFRFVTASEPGSFAAEFRTFLELEASGWKGKDGGAILCRRGIPGYFSAMTSAMRGDLDHFEMIAVYAEGRCLASMLCARTGRTYSFLKTAYNEADSHLRPGHVLLGFAMERCCDDPGIDWLDLVSDLPWLHGWRRESMDLQLGFLNTGGWRGRMLIRMLKLRLGPLRRSARRLKAVLARLGVHPGE